MDRFWAKVNKDGATPDPALYGDIGQCWEWTAALVNGYGRFKYSGRSVLAHRFVVKTKDCVLHICDNRRCVRPSHLFTGTRIDNLADMTAKSRRSCAANGNNGKLSQDAVDKLRALYKTGNHSQYELAERFDCSQQHISDVIHYKRRR